MLIKSEICKLPMEGPARGVEANTSKKKPGDPLDVPEYRGMPVDGMGKRIVEGGAWSEQRLIPRPL
jgi:hypothetical protein